MNEFVSPLEKNKPKLEDFKGPDYIKDSTKIKNDEELFKKSAEQDYESSLKSKIFEGILFKSGKKILGDGFSITPTTKYDDYTNGVDFIVESEIEEASEKKIIRFGIDTTVSGYTQRIEDKILNIKERINGEKKDKTKTKVNNNIKYFKSEITGEKTKLENLPRFVLAIDSTLWDTFMKVYKNEENSDVLRKDFLKMIKIQIENQFLYTMAHAYDSKRGELGVISYENLASKLQNLARNIVKKDRTSVEIEDLMKKFDRSQIALDKFMKPDDLKLLENLRDIYKVIISKFEFEDEDEQNKIADPINESAITKVLTRQWGPEEIVFGGYIHA